MQHWVSKPSPKGLQGSVPDSLFADMHWKLTVCSATERQFDNRDSALLCSEAIVWAKGVNQPLAYLP